MNKQNFKKYYEADIRFGASIFSGQSYRNVKQNIIQSEYFNYYIVQIPLVELNNCNIFDILNLGNDYSTIYCSCSKEQNQLFLDEYLEYLYEHTLGSDAEQDWFNTDKDWYFIEVTNTGVNNYKELWKKSRKWIVDNIDNACHNVQWSKSGDCQYYKFRNKDDAMKFKLVWI